MSQEENEVNPPIGGDEEDTVAGQIRVKITGVNMTPEQREEVIDCVAAIFDIQKTGVILSG